MYLFKKVFVDTSCKFSTSGMKLSICNQCPPSFLNQCEMKNQESAINQGPHKCRYCPASFNNTARLQCHVGRLHVEKVRQLAIKKVIVTIPFVSHIKCN